MKSLIIHISKVYNKNGYMADCRPVDIIGHGDTELDALKDLIDLIKIQIDFAIKQGDFNLFWFDKKEEKE